MSSTPSPSAPSTLVGRDRELGVLRDHLAGALAGRGSLVLISGEAGIGKTALAESLCHEAAEQGALVLVGRCYDLTETPPYGPWVELFGRFPRTDDAPPLPEVFATRGTLGKVTSQAALFQQVVDFFAALATTRPLSCCSMTALGGLRLARPPPLPRPLPPTCPILILATYRSDELTRHHPLSALLPLLVRESRHASRSATARTGGSGALVRGAVRASG